MVALCSTAQAWWGKGHLATARVAYEILQKKSPETVTKVESILKYLQDFDPKYTEKESDHPFVECSTFADDIKHKGGAYQ